jgi:DNA-binding protein HU-beta
MTKAELATEISKKTGIDKVQSIKVVESFMEVLKVNLGKNEPVYLRSFGTFYNKLRKTKTARNISKNTSIIIPEHFIPYFKPSREFINKIRAKKV